MALAQSFVMPFGQNRQIGDHAFEVDFAFSGAEAQLVSDAIAQRPESFVKEEVERFVSERQYTRYFNREPADPVHHQRQQSAHSLVQYTLRGAYGRPVGFSLRADRSYPSVPFQQQTLLQQRQDPLQRNIASAYQLPEFQYRDMLDFLIESQYHHLLNIGRFIENGGDAATRPESPLKEYNSLFEDLMPGYSITTLPSEGAPTNLYVQIPSGTIIPFSDLSSGEREVFFVLANFIRQNVSNAIITVDEPELHLHPELSRRLVRTMLDIKPGNQIWLATHNGEVFDEVGRDRTFYVSRRGGTSESIVRRASDASETETLLRDLFGYSGYIGVARSLLFLEGEEASLDRRLFSRLFPAELAEVKLVPAGGVDSVTRLNSAVLQVIEGGIGWMTFYAIRDRDYLTDAEVANYNKHPTGRLRVLERCHIENYLLVDEVITKVLCDVFGMQLEPGAVRASLESIAKAMSAEVLAKMVSFRLQRKTWPEDFEISGFRGASVLNADSTPNQGLLQAMEHSFTDKANAVGDAIGQRLSTDAIATVITESTTTVVEALAADFGSKSWRNIYPGKRLLEELAKLYGVAPIALQNSVLIALSSRRELIAQDLRDLVSAVSSGDSFPAKSEGNELSPKD
ncbi:hypothetical protein LQK93_02592 [Terrabacter sp. BE26]